MAYIKYKVTDELHSNIRALCKKMGIKESELSRVALIEYMKELGSFNRK